MTCPSEGHCFDCNMGPLDKHFSECPKCGGKIARYDAPPTCRSCGAPIFFVRSRKIEPGTKKQKWIPVDNKYLTVVTDEGTVVKGRVSHFSTCPNAAEHRKG